ncbi:hypothetical protein ACWGKU_18400 [Kitasatospora sp. NPDC054768]|uniref:hypothetical protein n=1 Tax=Kitasatospora sp. NBC_01519 TaxID=2903576 RepID=UPI002F9186B3
MAVNARQFSLRGWTIVLTTGRGYLHTAVTRPHPLDPARWDGPQPAYVLALRAALTDTYATDPAPERCALRDYPRRVWRRWVHRHPDAALQPAGPVTTGPWDRCGRTRTVGPWSATLDRCGVRVRRLPEFDCDWHAPVTDEDCFPSGRYAYEPEAGSRPVCTCPRIRPWLRLHLTRPERVPAQAPF